MRDNFVISKFLMCKKIFSANSERKKRRPEKEKNEKHKYLPHLKLDILKKHVCATIVKSQNFFSAIEK